MSKSLQDEIDSNFEKFESSWPKELAAAQLALAPSVSRFRESYTRISSVQAWRALVVSKLLEPEAEAFFFEAQNDLLISHCLARSGSFRQALKALRSSIENVYFALYYMDHPIELENWALGRHRPGFSELHSYFEGHPRVGGDVQLSGLETLKSEYATLSRAVHGSAKSFRMTKDLNEARLWIADATHVGQWATREKSVITSINLLLSHIFQSELQGAKLLSLRSSIGLVIPTSRRSPLKSKLGISIVPS